MYVVNDFKLVYVSIFKDDLLDLPSQTLRETV